MNILFVCSANKLRSKTAEDYFSDKYADTGNIFISAGTNIKTCLKEGTVPLEEWMLEWADSIYVMEKKHKEEILAYTKEYLNKIIVLGIKDNYSYYQLELIELLENKVKIWM
jgi:predicted protein tyrosine phosphatase